MAHKSRRQTESSGLRKTAQAKRKSRSYAYSYGSGILFDPIKESERSAEISIKAFRETLAQELRSN